MITRMVVRSIRLRPPPHSSAGIARGGKAVVFAERREPWLNLIDSRRNCSWRDLANGRKLRLSPGNCGCRPSADGMGSHPPRIGPACKTCALYAIVGRICPCHTPHHRRRWHEKRKRNAGRKPRSERNAPSAKPRRDWASVSPDRSEAQSPVRLLRSASDAMRNCLPRPIASQDQLRLRTCSMGISGSEGSRKATRPCARCSESLCELRRLTIRAPCNICPRASIATNGRTGKITPAMRASLGNRAVNDAASRCNAVRGTVPAHGSPDQDPASGLINVRSPLRSFGKGV